MDQLLREGNPPPGQLAAPKPQHWDPSLNSGAGGWSDLYGQGHASRVLLWGLNDQPLLTETNPGHVVLSGRIEPSVTEELSTTPLAASASYISDSWDCQEFVFPNGSKGIVSVSALAVADVQGTLYLEGSNDDTSWHVVGSVAVNNTGVGRLRRINVFTRYVRLRFLNGTDAQTSFSLSRSLWQVSDGQGDQHGQGADGFSRFGALAPGVSEIVMDIRSAMELQELIIAGDYADTEVTIIAYKDDGSGTYVSAVVADDGAGYSNYTRFSQIGPNIIGLFNPTAVHDPQSNKYSMRIPGARVFAKGLRLTVRHQDPNASHNVGVFALCRLL